MFPFCRKVVSFIAQGIFISFNHAETRQYYLLGFDHKDYALAKLLCKRSFVMLLNVDKTVLTLPC